MTILTRSDYTRARETFMWMLRDSPLVIDEELGICGNVEEGMWPTQCYYVMAEHVKTWPYYTDRRVYPVPSVHQGKSAGQSYCIDVHTKKLWTGDGLMYRRSLLRHLIRICDEQGE